MIQGIFLGGESGQWRVDAMQTLHGAPLPAVPYLRRVARVEEIGDAGFLWQLRGVTSAERYTSASEKAFLQTHQPTLGREAATSATLIPLVKSATWWDLAQDERRAIFEERSHHIAIGTNYFPQIARRLFHARDLGEPFDFLTWFEYAPSDAAAFDDLLGKLRETEEWQYVEREVDIRLSLVVE